MDTRARQHLEPTTTLPMISRPDPTEHIPYFSRYIDLVPDGDLLPTLRSQLAQTMALVRSLDEADGGYRYGREKWSIREVLGHMIDTERVMCYRALHFARRDPAPLPSVDFELLAENANSDARTIADLADEMEHVRLATIDLFRAMDEEVLRRRGIASEVECSVRALAWIIAGHEIHHTRIIAHQYLHGLRGPAPVHG